MTRHLVIKIPQFRTLNIIGAVILSGLVVSGLIIINNINKEFAIRQIAGRFQEFKYATLSFNNVYSGLPGDITNATFYWKDVTKDGNGNRRIEHEPGEGIAAFQQLQLAKLVGLPKELTGKWDAKGEGILVPDVNVPAARDNSGFYFNYVSELNINVFGIGEADGKPGVFTNPALTPNEAYMLDLMIDDGYPSKGNIIAATSIDSGCFIAGEYKQEKERKECLALFKL